MIEFRNAHISVEMFCSVEWNDTSKKLHPGQPPFSKPHCCWRHREYFFQYLELIFRRDNFTLSFSEYPPDS